MPFYEYKVVPAPARTPKVKGLKGPARFAHALTELMNAEAQDGWEYLRAESLPEEEKKGFMSGTETVTRTVLVFRRELYFEEGMEEAAPLAATPAPAPLTLSRRVDAPAAAQVPVRAEAAPDIEADMEADMDSIYSGAAPRPAEGAPSDQPARRPLVADRKGQGVDF